MPTPRKLDVRKAIQAKLAGQSYHQIARVQGVSSQTVHQTVAPLLKALPNAAELAEMKASMADHAAVTAYRTIASITDSVIESASLQQRATTAGILIDKSRLLSGESTQNVAVLISSAVRETPMQFNGAEIDDEI